VRSHIIKLVNEVV